MARTNQEPRFIRDLIGQRVRMNYYNRDAVGRQLWQIPANERGPFDIDRTVEGTLQLIRTIPSADGGVYLYGVMRDDNTLNDNVPLLPPHAALVGDGGERGYDNRANGEYNITVITT